MSIADLRAKMKQMMLVAEDDGSSNNNDRFWKLTTDSNKNGNAVIRFLPAKDLSKLPYVTTYSHWFTHPVTGKNYQELSGSTWKEPDPMGEFNAWLWKKGEETKVRSQKRATKYYANILVVKDPAKPENDGKVFLFRFGSKILDKIKAQLSPQYEDETPVNVFDLFEGQNFRLRSKEVAGYLNYDDSVFDSKITPVAQTDEEIEAIYSRVYELESMFLDKSKDKSYDQKLEIMRTVFGRDPLFAEWLTVTGNAVAPAANNVTVDDEDEAPAPAKKAAPVKKAAPAEVKAESSDSDVDSILAELGL